MARINVEKKALTDARFVRLGRHALAAGAVPRSTIERAIGLLLAISVWDECQESGRYVLPPGHLDAIGDGLGICEAAAGMLASDLGEVRRGGVRIRGSAGRVEWLERRRREGRTGGAKGGRPRRASSISKPPGDDGQSTPRGLPCETPPTPAPTPALSEPEGEGRLLVDRETAPAGEGPGARPPALPAGSRTGNGTGPKRSVAQLVDSRKALRRILPELEPGTDRAVATQREIDEITAELNERYPEHADGAA